MTSNQKTNLKQTSDCLKQNKSEYFLTLLQAANTFVKHKNGSVQIWAASRDWFLEEWGRDTFISLPGLLLYTRRFDEAKEVFRRFSRFEKCGLIPNRIREDEILYNTADASLWFIQSLETYVMLSGDVDFLYEMLPTVRNIIDAYRHGTFYFLAEADQQIFMDKDGLIVSPKQATWMDANPDPHDLTACITPRDGKAVEINALWYASLLIVGNWESKVGNENHSQILLDLAKTVKKSFRKKFWNEAEQCLLDVIEGDSHSGALRPNQIFAVSHGKDLLSRAQQKKVFEAVKKDLLTPAGLRTLSPRDSYYHAHYDTYLPMSEKDQAYHQGTVWPWLMGAYADALFTVGIAEKISKDRLREYLAEILGPLVDFAWESEFRSLPEVFSAESPHDPGGTTSQAWSVAEVLRVLIQYRLI